MRFLTSPDGTAIGLHEHGGDGRPTLLCHATGFHGAVWEPLARELGDSYRRWAIDFRGHGASTIEPDASLDWELVMTDVLTAVDAIDAEPGTILGVGHSMGGACLLLAEQARPGTFAGLWLFEPIAPPPGLISSARGGNSLAEGALRRRSSFPSHAAAIENFASKPPFNTLRADALHAYVRHGFVPGDDGEVHLACRPEDESRIYLGGGGHGAFEHLGEVRCPTVVAVSGDEFGPALFAPAIVEGLPDGRLEPHPHVTHFGPLEAPTALAAAIAEFEQSLPARA